MHLLPSNTSRMQALCAAGCILLFAGRGLTLLHFCQGFFPAFCGPSGVCSVVTCATAEAYQRARALVQSDGLGHRKGNELLGHRWQGHLGGAHRGKDGLRGVLGQMVGQLRGVRERVVEDDGVAHAHVLQRPPRRVGDDLVQRIQDLQGPRSPACMGGVIHHLPVKRMVRLIRHSHVGDDLVQRVSRPSLTCMGGVWLASPRAPGTLQVSNQAPCRFTYTVAPRHGCLHSGPFQERTKLAAVA